MHRTQLLLLELSKTKNLSQYSLRNLGKLVGENHPQKIKYHLNQLAKLGLIKLDKRFTKQKLIKTPINIIDKDLISISFKGEANCGPANIYVQEHSNEFLKVSKKLLVKTKDIFALKAKGNSMNQAFISGNSIEDGDYLIIDEKYDTPKNYDIVASIIDSCINIKKLYIDKENKRIVLLSESNENINPIFLDPTDLDQYRIVGKVIQVIKKFSNFKND